MQAQFELTGYSDAMTDVDATMRTRTTPEADAKKQKAKKAKNAKPKKAKPKKAKPKKAKPKKAKPKGIRFHSFIQKIAHSEKISMKAESVSELNDMVVETLQEICKLSESLRRIDKHGKSTTGVTFRKNEVKSAIMLKLNRSKFKSDKKEKGMKNAITKIMEDQLKTSSDFVAKMKEAGEIKDDTERKEKRKKLRSKHSGEYVIPTARIRKILKTCSAYERIAPVALQMLSMRMTDMVRDILVSADELTKDRNRTYVTKYDIRNALMNDVVLCQQFGGACKGAKDHPAGAPEMKCEKETNKRKSAPAKKPAKKRPRSRKK